MKFSRNLHALDANWHENLVEVWTEDDASRSAGDKTRLQLHPHAGCDWNDRTKIGAWKAITGFDYEPDTALATHDAGDFYLTLFPGGWVRYSGFDGDAIYLHVMVSPDST